MSSNPYKSPSQSNGIVRGMVALVAIWVTGAVLPGMSFVISSTIEEYEKTTGNISVVPVYFLLASCSLSPILMFTGVWLTSWPVLLKTAASVVSLLVACILFLFGVFVAIGIEGVPVTSLECPSDETANRPMLVESSNWYVGRLH